MTDDRNDDQPDDRNRDGWWLRWYTRRWGRYYGTFRPGSYLLPCDSEEDDRLDIMHKFFTVVREYEDSTRGLYTHRLPNRPKVLDLGCGTGIWAIETALRLGGLGDYHIEGWDLNMNQPESIPRGVSFHRRDMEEPWRLVEPNSYDLIHMRQLNGSIKDWRRLYGQIFQHLKPGSGYLEQVELDLRPQSEDDQSPLRDSKLAEWSQKVHLGFAAAQRNLEMNPDTRLILEEIGFIEIEHKQINIAFNTWPEDEQQKEMARWFNLGLTRGLDALTFESVIHYLNIPEEQVRELIEKVKVDITKREWRMYCTLHIFVARRPPLDGRRA